MFAAPGGIEFTGGDVRVVQTRHSGSINDTTLPDADADQRPTCRAFSGDAEQPKRHFFAVKARLQHRPDKQDKHEHGGYYREQKKRKTVRLFHCRTNWPIVDDADLAARA